MYNSPRPRAVRSRDHGGWRILSAARAAGGALSVRWRTSGQRSGRLTSEGQVHRLILLRKRPLNAAPARRPSRMTKNPPGHIRLTSHPSGDKPHRYPIEWGAATIDVRGAVIGSTTARVHRNVIGAHGGAYSVYRALAVSSGTLDPEARPDL